MKNVFDSGESWSLFKTEPDYFLIFKPPVFDEPYLIARIDPGHFKGDHLLQQAFLIEEQDGLRIHKPGAVSP